MKRVRASHEFPPFVHPDAEVLILGSFPSVKSRESQFFYGHPQNRFWKVLASFYQEEEPLNVEAKSALLLKHHIACYDVIESCSIEGSSDASIRNVKPADLGPILGGTQIKNILLNGKTAEKYFHRYQQKWEGRGLKIVALPSTSPANAAVSLSQLIEAWSPLLPVD
jgi:hypoxanthine-DNA glycosylase